MERPKSNQMVCMPLLKKKEIYYTYVSILLLGITIFVSSGDSGVSGGNCSCNGNVDSSTFEKGFWNGNTYKGKGYFPDHPASSPYVVSVS